MSGQEDVVGRGRDQVKAFVRRRPFAIGVFVEGPAICLGVLLYRAVIGGGRMPDFGWLRAGSLAVLHGRTLYPAPEPQLLALNDKFIYPALDAFVLAPVAVLPRMAANVVFLGLSVGAVILALRLLGVRDPRCFALTILAPATFFAFSFGTLGPFLLLGVAAAWHWRDRPAQAGLVVAVTVVAKLFVWPLFVWLAVTRRWRALAVAVAAAAFAIVVPWAAIGFQGLRNYPRLLSVLDQVQVPKAYSLAGLAWDLGLSGRIGTGLLVAVAIVGCIAMVRIARRPAGDMYAFALAVVVALASTPLLWTHDLILLYAPLALAYPRLSWAWAAPIVLWVAFGPGATPGWVWQPLVVLVTTALFGALLWARRPARPGRVRPGAFPVPSVTPEIVSSWSPPR